MSKIGDSNIAGNGNAVGDNNRILIHQNIYNRPTGNGGGNGARGGPGRDDASSGVAGVAIVVLVGIAFLSWKFAIYAEPIYRAGLSIAAFAFVSQILSMGVGIHNGVDSKWLCLRLLAASATALLFVAISWSRAAYPAEFSIIAAQSTGWHDFICALSKQGQQIAILHMLSIGVIGTCWLILLGGNAVGALSACLTLLTDSFNLGSVTIFPGIERWLAIGAAMAGIVVASQTSAGLEIWREVLFNADRNPFGPSAGFLNFCPALAS